MIAKAKNNSISSFGPLERETLLPPVQFSHPEYRLTLEVLSRIPLSPICARFSAIVNDLGADPDMVRVAVNLLGGSLGYSIYEQHTPYGSVLSLAPASWEKAQDATQKYYNAVYASWDPCYAVAAQNKGR